MDHAFQRTALDLARLQREFHDYMLHRDPAVLQHVVGTGAADAATRMDVYADGYSLRLLEALEEDYPGLKAIAGSRVNHLLGRQRRSWPFLMVPVPALNPASRR